jgi:hypothetical protein
MAAMRMEELEAHCRELDGYLDRLDWDTLKEGRN